MFNVFILTDTSFSIFVYFQEIQIATIQKYLNKLNPENENFWQRPKRVFNREMLVWYDNCAVGKNTLNNFMAELSKDAGLSAKYTNHCIRATCITALDQKGVEARHIMSISGHKSENSIRSYSERLSESKKRQISDILSENVIPSKTPKQSTCNSVIIPSESSHVTHSVSSGCQGNEETNSNFLLFP